MGRVEVDKVVLLLLLQLEIVEKCSHIKLNLYDADNAAGVTDIRTDLKGRLWK